MATKKSDENAEFMKLEDAMARLEQVVTSLEGENTDLDKALKLYEEGVKMVALCQNRLEDARRTIEVLRVSPEGELLRERFDTE